MITINEVWISRAKCNAGYFWTNPGSPNIVCTCGNHEIRDNVILSGDPVTDEEEFKQAVADCYGVSINKIRVEQGLL